MVFDFPEFKSKLIEAVKKSDKRSCTNLVKEFKTVARDEPGSITAEHVDEVLKILKKKCFFSLMTDLCSLFHKQKKLTQTGMRLFGQALIETDRLEDAEDILNELLQMPGLNNSEFKEAKGLLGRVFKQLYINNPSGSKGRVYIQTALDHYLDVYEKENVSFYHGINAIAISFRAKKEGFELKNSLDNKAAENLLGKIEKMEDAFLQTWDMATAMEACLALGKDEQAVEWLKRYIGSQNADAFELGSTLRQMKEVWQLTLDEGIGKQVLPVLESMLLRQEDGNLTLNIADIVQHTQLKKDKQYEKVFGADRYKTYQWYLDGLNCCSAVARIGLDSSKGQGTGFLLKGEELHLELKGQIVLLTNAHVVSNNPEKNNNSLLPWDAVVILETVGKTIELRVKEIFRSSDMNELDFSILLFDEKSTEKLEKIKKKICYYKIARRLPATDGKNRLYIIGHPGGGTLQISLQDNAFIAHKDPFLHYRTPTEGGSSGSPVFNENWQLVGLHHAGDEQMEKLDGSGEKYEANEGISIQSIIQKLSKN